MSRKKAVARKYVSDFVYGAVDGTVTTFAIVSSAVGAEFSAVIVIILGFANLFADGFSMAASNYLSKTEAESSSNSKYYALKSGLATFVSFFALGLMPLLPFLTLLIWPSFQNPFIYSVVLTGITFFVIGWIKGTIENSSRIKNAFKTLSIGGIAAGIAYLLGYLLHNSGISL